MQQAVEDRGREDLVAEDGAPLGDDLVRWVMSKLPRS
jgi:hypothetical protein